MERSAGRLACREAGRGSGPVIVIFWTGGAGGGVDDDAEESESESGDSSSAFAGCVEVEEDGSENRLSPAGSADGGLTVVDLLDLRFDDVEPFVLGLRSQL